MRDCPVENFVTSLPGKGSSITMLNIPLKQPRQSDAHYHPRIGMTVKKNNAFFPGFPLIGAQNSHGI